MKADFHPEYKESVIQCSCGAIIQTRSTSPDMRVGICSSCHPFFTGEQRFVDTAGRVDKFTQRYGSAKARRVAPKPAAAAPEVAAVLEAAPEATEVVAEAATEASS